MLAACARQPPAVVGPSAYVRDSWAFDESGNTLLFVVEAIDGQSVPNSVEATSRASSKIGVIRKPFTPVVDIVGRKVEARPSKLTIKGTHATAAPILELASRATGNFKSVEGVIDFTPEPDGLYVVKGELGKDASSVWIEDLNTNRVVSKKVTN